MHIHSKIHTVSPRKGHSCASVQIPVTKHKHSPQRNLTTQKISLFQNKFTLKVSFKIHSCQAYSNISLFRISITCKFLSLGEVGIPKQKPGISPPLEEHRGKEQFQLEDAEGTRAAGEEPSFTRSCPMRCGKRTWRCPLEPEQCPQRAAQGAWERWMQGQHLRHPAIPGASCCQILLAVAKVSKPTASHNLNQGKILWKA